LQTPDYSHSVQKSSAGPLGHVARRLRKGTDVETALRIGLGRELASKVVRAACGAKLRDVRAPRELIRITRTGRAHAPPRTARVEIGRSPVHDANARCVRRLALMLVHVLGWLGPAGRTGHARQAARLRVDVLADKCALGGRPLDRKEIQRYLAVLRSAGILSAWQPPAYDENGVRNTLPVGPSGHCFNFYELTGDVPPELERALASFHRLWWPRRVAAPLVPKGAPVDGAGIAAALRARKAPS
jgi:hypothetical protein